MNAFHEYLASTIAERLRARRIVVWYDPRREWSSFVDELSRQAMVAAATVQQVQVDDTPVALCCYGGSFWAVRGVVEPLVAVDRPAPLIVYLPGVERDPDSSVLMELELGGTVYNQSLKREARQFLRRFYTEGDIDEMLAPAALRYDDVVALGEAASSGDGPASMLKVLLPKARDPEAIVVGWLAEPALDTSLERRGLGPSCTG